MFVRTVSIVGLLFVAATTAPAVPPACSGLFEDVPCSSPFAGWIEDLVNREITSGCAVEPLRYCPANGVLRGQIAAFLVATFGLPFNW